MGNRVSCFSCKDDDQYSSNQRGLVITNHGDKTQTQEEQVLQQQQAIAMLLQQQISKSYSQRYPRSSSARTAGLKQSLPRSASARPHNGSDSLGLVAQPQHALQLGKDKKNIFPELETNKFVLVHGGGFGGWCWYKTIALLEEAGFIATALDLSGSGINARNPNEIASMEQYMKPLSELLEHLPDHEKINLVAHSLGGACVSYAMECYPSKISKAIFVSAAMIKNGQAALDVFSQEIESSNQLVSNVQGFVYANGKDCPPTSMELEKSQMKDTFFNRTSAKDVALSILSVRPIPFAPFAEKISLSDKNYGSVRRFFIQTMDDQIFTTAIQEKMIQMNPPEHVMKLKGSDHCPFFSKPQSLHSLLVNVAQLEANRSA